MKPLPPWMNQLQSGWTVKDKWDALRARGRHRSPERNCRILREAWKGITWLLHDGAHIVVRIGGRHLEEKSKAEQPLFKSR